MNPRFLLIILIFVMFSLTMSCSRMDRGIKEEVFLLLSSHGEMQLQVIEEM